MKKRKATKKKYDFFPIKTMALLEVLEKDRKQLINMKKDIKYCKKCDKFVENNEHKKDHLDQFFYDLINEQQRRTQLIN